ncbi:unnamed protein product [Caenorhabditis bovis]|uniref:3-phosphoinositide-dependent protein kinase 1 n=1 Tax=Caenorhabditis bovis TaxID=2654633 RepID=A0A8S1EJX7_9PELO|nr:unnamed protein product [Caenorhabditis bovis]
MNSVDNCRLAASLIRETVFDGCPRRTPKDFAFLQAIGEGAYSCVYKAREIRSGAEFAIKVIQKAYVSRHQMTNSIIREKNILNYLTQMSGGNPFVSQLYTTFQDASRMYLVMMFAEKGDLLDAMTHFGSFDIGTSRFFCSEILSGLDYLHHCNIVHRDLKPENILIKADGHVMITDFGSAQAYQDLCLPHIDFGDEENYYNRSCSSSPLFERRFEESHPDANNGGQGRRTTFVGTAQYVSPEMLSDGEVGPHSDIWAFGCILYQCLSGLAPFRAVNQYHMMRKIQEVDYSFPDGFPQIGRGVINKILVGDIDERATIDEVMDDVFFDGVDWDNINEVTPPTLHAYLPAAFGEPEFYSDVVVKPGLDDHALIRLMNLVPATENKNEEGNNVEEEQNGNAANENEEIVVKNDEEEVHGVVADQKVEEVAIPQAPTVAPEPAAEPVVEKSTPVKEEKSSKKDEKSLEGMKIEPLEAIYFDGNTDEPFELNPRTQSQILRNHILRQKRLEKQRLENPYHLFTNGELILKQGFLEKKRGLFARKRMFILTEGPHLLYVDPSNMELKGEIPWTPCMNIEIKNFGTFIIHTPNRVYYLFDEERRALEWCQAIESLRQRYETEIEETYNNGIADGTFFTTYGKKKSRKEIMRAEKALRRKKAKEEKKAAKKAAQLAAQAAKRNSQ